MKATAVPTPRDESKALLNVAWPLFVSYVVDVAGVLIAKVTVGKFGFKELAAVGLTTDISFSISIVAMSLFSVVGVLVAEARGARQPERILVALIQGLVLAAIVGLVLSVFTYHLGSVLGLLGQSPEVVAIATPYCKAYSYSVLPFVLFSVLRSFAAAMGKSTVVMVATLISVIFQYVLMNGLAHGAYGMPALGVAGAGAGWSIANALKFFILAAMVLWIISRAKLPMPHGGAAASLIHIGHFLWLGIPIAVVAALETFFFSATSIMSGWLGPVVLAAYQMLMGWISIPFVISLGFADASMVRVSYWTGAQSRAAARQAGILGMVIGIALPLILVIIPLTAPKLIAKFFLSPADPGFSEVAALLAGLLIIGAVFQVFDGLQAIASHALRGVKDTRVPMIICAVGYWLVGAPASYILAFKFGWGAHGLWWGVALGLGVTAWFLSVRFLRLTR